LLAGYKGPEDLIGEQGLLKQLTKALVERAMNTELTHLLSYEKHDASGRGSGNSRNGISRKKLKGDFGEAEIEVPRATAHLRRRSSRGTNGVSPRRPAMVVSSGECLRLANSP
jgi:mutator family transposase